MIFSFLKTEVSKSSELVGVIEDAETILMARDDLPFDKTFCLVGTTLEVRGSSVGDDEDKNDRVDPKTLGLNGDDDGVESDGVKAVLVAAAAAIAKN